MSIGCLALIAQCLNCTPSADDERGVVELALPRLLCGGSLNSIEVRSLTVFAALSVKDLGSFALPLKLLHARLHLEGRLHLLRAAEDGITLAKHHRIFKESAQDLIQKSLANGCEACFPSDELDGMLASNFSRNIRPITARLGRELGSRRMGYVVNMNSIPIHNLEAIPPGEADPYMPDYKRTNHELAAALWSVHREWKRIYGEGSPFVAFYPLDGHFIGFLRYGSTQGAVMDPQDKGHWDWVDYDCEYMLELTNASYFPRVAFSIASKLRKRGWQHCALQANSPADLELRCVWIGLQIYPVDVTIHYVVRRGRVVAGTSFAPRRGIPLTVIHPLKRCSAFGIPVPCIRDPQTFFSLWRFNKYRVDCWCLALPYWKSGARSQHFLAAIDIDWMKQGLEQWFISALMVSWWNLESSGMASLREVWEKSPACRRAQRELRDTGRFLNRKPAPGCEDTMFIGDSPIVMGET